MKMFAIFGFVAGALFMLHGGTTDTQSAIHQIYTALWSIGGAQVIMLSAILWSTAKPVSPRNVQPKN